MEQIQKYLESIDASAIKLDGFDDAVIGLAQSFSGFVIVYDQQKILDILQKDMTEEEAWEYYYYNIKGAYLDNDQPIFMIDTNS